MKSNALTVDEFISGLSPERQAVIKAVRKVILDNLPDGYKETINWGMISYEIPLEVYPDTYNGKPLSYIALASQKNHMTIYLMSIYGDEKVRKKFEGAYRASGKRYDVGKSCVRFKKLENLPLSVIAEAVRSMKMTDYVVLAKNALAERKNKDKK